MRAVFFDLDGTLLDTAPDIRAALNRTLVEFGYPPHTDGEVKKFVGNGARKLIERALPAGCADLEAVYARFRTVYAASDNALTRPFDGIGELLDDLKGAGASLAVITNKPQEATAHVIDTFFPARFDFVGGDSGLFPCKPDPSYTRYAALTLRVAPKDCVFVGDGETDIRTARRAGMRSVAALWGYRSRAVLRRAGASVFAEDVAALRKILLEFCENR